MIRHKELFEVFLSRDGEKWKSFGSINNPMSKYLCVGLMVSSHRTSQRVEVVFDNVSITGTAPSPDQFNDEVTKSIRRSSGIIDCPRDPRLLAFEPQIKQLRTERENLTFPVRKKLSERSNLPPKAKHL